MKRSTVFLIVLSAVFIFTGCLGTEYTQKDLIFEGILEENDPLLVSLCIATDYFSEEEYERFKAALGRAVQEFEPFDLKFYIIHHEERDFPKKLNGALPALWRADFEEDHNIVCDIMVLVTNKHYENYDGCSIAGIALLGWDGIIIDSFSHESFVDIKRATQHELGHIFGAVHVFTSGSVMRPMVNNAGNEWDELNFNIIMENRYRFK